MTHTWTRVYQIKQVPGPHSRGLRYFRRPHVKDNLPLACPFVILATDAYLPAW